MAHCHYLIAPEDAQLGMPEVTLPVVPGMEGCHWPLRKAAEKDRTKLVSLLLTGAPVRAKDAVGWLVDFAGPMPQAMKTAWQVASNGDHGLKRRSVEQKALKAPSAAGVPAADGAANEAARKAILDSIQASCGATLAEALGIQAKHSAGFMTSKVCLGGAIGAEYTKTMRV